MAISPSTENYSIFSGSFLFDKNFSGNGYRHFGNIPELSVSFEVNKESNFSSMAEMRVKDDEWVTETNVSASGSFMDITAQNLADAMLGAVSSGTQSAGSLDAQVFTTAAGLYKDIGKTGLTYFKIYHGTPTGGTFSPAGTLTFDDSETCKIVWADTTNNILYCITASGTLAAGQDATDATATAAINRIETVSGVIVTDAATATKMYVKSTDYDDIPAGALIRENSAGDIAANTVYISADYPLLNVDTVSMLENSETTGEAVFIGTNSKGNRIKQTFHKVTLTIDGDLSLIGDGTSLNTIPFSMEILADTTRAVGDQYYSTEVISA